MKRLLFVLAMGLVAASCRGRSSHDEGGEYGKSVEKMDDTTFDSTRKSFSADMHERLARLDARMRELGVSGSEKTREAAEKLRVDRDKLATKVDEIDMHAKKGFDKFESNLKKDFSDLERKVDSAFKD